MPSSSSRRGRGCLILLLVVVLLAGLVAVLRQPLGRLGVELAVRLLTRNMSGRVEYERIEGDLFSHPTVVGLRVYLNGDSLRVERVSMRYAPLGFLAGRIPISEVELVRPEFFFADLPAFHGTVGDTGEPGPFNLPRLNLRRLVVQDARFFLRDTLRVDSLNLVASGRSDRTSARIELERLQGLAVQEGLALRAATARCRLNQRVLLLDQLDVRTDRSRLSGSARLAFDNGAVAMELSNLEVDLGEFAGFLDAGGAAPGGVFRARGSASLGELGLKAELDYTLQRPEFGAVRLPNLSGALRLDQTLLRLSVSGSDEMLGSFSASGTFDYEQLSYQARAELRRIRVAGFDPSLPDITLDADLTVAGTAFDPIQLEAGGRLPELGIDTFRLAGRRAGRRVEVTRFAAQGRSGRIQAAGSWRTDGRVQGECLFEEFDIAPFARLAGVEATGTLRGLVQASGTVDSVAVSGGVRIDGFTQGDLVIGAGVVELDVTVGRELQGRLVVGAERIQWGEQSLDAAQLTLLDADFDLRADRSGDRLTARGTYQLGRDRVQLDVTGFEFAAGNESLVLVEPFRVAWSSDTLAVTGVRYEVADGRLELDVVRAGEENPEVALAVRGLDLARLRELLRLDSDISGTIDLTVTGRDTLVCELSASGLAMPDIGLTLRYLGLSARYSDSRVMVDRVSAVHDADTSTISGWAEFATDGGFRLAGVDLVAELADPGSWLLFFLRDIIDLRAGRIYGSLAVKGDLSTLDLSGRLRVSRGQLWVPSISMLVERVNAEITAGNGRVNVEKVSGSAGTGVVTAEGFVELGADWELDTLAFDIRFDDAVLRPMPEVHVVASGEVLLALAANRPLSISGTILVREALLAFGFGQAAPPVAPSGEPDPVVFDIRIRGERGIWLRNRIADIELSVDLSLRKTTQDETWTGELITRQGNIYYLDRTLRVSRGEIRFQSISTLDPELDIVAELPVHARNGESGALPERILLTLGGTLNKPEFRFSSEPVAWDENDILTYLSLNVTPDEVDAFQDREAVARYLSGRLLGLAQTQVTKQVRQWLSVDALRFESELTGGEGQRVTVGKYVGRNLYITYSQSFTGELTPEFRVEYYLNRRNEIVGERSEGGRFSVRYRHRLRY